MVCLALLLKFVDYNNFMLYSLWTIYICLARVPVSQALVIWPWHNQFHHGRFISEFLIIPCSLVNIYIYIYIYIYTHIWKLNQTVLELDFRAVNFLFFPRQDLNYVQKYLSARHDWPDLGIIVFVISYPFLSIAFSVFFGQYICPAEYNF